MSLFFNPLHFQVLYQHSPVCWTSSYNAAAESTIYIYIQSNLSILSDVKLIQFSWARGNQTFLPIFLQNELHNMLKIYHGILTVPRTSTSLCSLPIMTCIGILYIHFSECILMLILCQNKTAADMKHCRKPLKPLSTLPEEIHISKLEDL